MAAETSLISPTAADISMDSEQARYFRDEFRRARAEAQRDAEGFAAIVHVLERLAALLRPGVSRRDGVGLGRAITAVASLAGQSPLADEIPVACPSFHTPFRMLYAQVQDGRNDAFHEGAAARHLTGDAIILATILEDALMTGARTVGDYMIRQPVCAQLWQPLSFIRQIMLVNSYSHLPVDIGDGPAREWRLLTDAAIARFTRADSANERFKRLRLPLKDAIGLGLEIRAVRAYHPTTSIQEVLAECDGAPVLVTEEAGILIGLATPVRPALMR